MLSIGCDFGRLKVENVTNRYYVAQVPPPWWSPEQRLNYLAPWTLVLLCHGLAVPAGNQLTRPQI